MSYHFNILDKLTRIKDREIKTGLTQESVKSLFIYKNGKLYWKIGRVKGKEAGSLFFQKKGKYPYRICFINKKRYSVAQLVFLYFHGFLPKYICYLDGDTLNTNMWNLRSVDKKELPYIKCFKKIDSNVVLNWKSKEDI